MTITHMAVIEFIVVSSMTLYKFAQLYIESDKCQ
jgi:hypothetical protein